MQAAAWFSEGVKPLEVARRLRVSNNSACVWRRRWRAGGEASDIHHTRPGVRVRAIEYTLPGRDDVYRLITTILDPTQAPATELASLYAQRWEFESTLDEIKTHLGGPHLILRSQHPTGAEQELYGFLLVHHAIRRLTHQAAVEGDHDPDRISFTRSLRVVRRQVIDQAAFSPRQTHPRRQTHAR